jgi:hypothetical protein
MELRIILLGFRHLLQMASQYRSKKFYQIPFMINVFTTKTLSKKRGLSNVRFDSSLKGRRVGTNNFVNLLAVLEEHESGHSTDTELSSNFREVVNVDLVKLGVLELVLVAEALEDGRDSLARTAPGRGTVDNDWARGLLDLLLEDLGAGVGVSSLISSRIIQNMYIRTARERTQ